MTAAARGTGRRIRFPDAAGVLDDSRCRPIPTSASRLRRPGDVGRRIEASGADHIHIATEGPIGWAARRYCLQRGRMFTTSYHTRFPEYIAARTVDSRRAGPMPRCGVFMRRRPASWRRRPRSATNSQRRGFRARERVDPRRRSRAVPAAARAMRSICRGRSFSASAASRSKRTSKRFLRLDLPGSKVVVGDGPARAPLERRYPERAFPRRALRRGARPKSMRAPTFSSFPRAPTHSASC